MNTVDLIVVGVIMGSAGLAFARGFLLEVLSLTGYAGAAIVTFISMPVVQPLLSRHIAHKLLAQALSVVLVFVVTVGVFAVINNKISEKVRQSSLNAVDRSLGFVFGVARGAVLVSLGFLLTTWLWTEDHPPQLLSSARTLPALQMGGDVMRTLVVNVADALGAERADAWFAAVDKAGKDAAKAKKGKPASGEILGEPEADDPDPLAEPDTRQIAESHRAAAKGTAGQDDKATGRKTPLPLVNPDPGSEDAVPAADPNTTPSYSARDRAEMRRLLETHQ